MIEKMPEFLISPCGTFMRQPTTAGIVEKINEIIDYLNSKESINHE